MKELMKRIFPHFTPSRITLMESTRETVSLSQFFFFFGHMQETVRHRFPTGGSRPTRGPQRALWGVASHILKSVER